MSSGCIKKSLFSQWKKSHFIFTHIPFLDNCSPYFLMKKGIKLLKEKALEMVPKYGTTEAQSCSQGSEKNNNI